MEDELGVVDNPQQTPPPAQPVSTTQTPPADGEIPKGYHNDPAWQRILSERNEAREKANAAQQQLNTLQQQLQAPKPADKTSTGLPQTREELFAELYPDIKKQIFADAAAIEERIRQEQSAKDAEVQEKREAAEEKIKSIQTDLGDQYDSWADFANKILEEEPDAGWTLDALVSAYKRANTVPQVPSRVAKPSSGGTGNDRALPVQSDDLVGLARAEAKKRGII